LDFSIEVKEYELPHSPIMRWAKGIGGVKWELLGLVGMENIMKY
jgi:hypothetical protein